jgi:DNA-binding GntR family transcriptional regulator
MSQPNETEIYKKIKQAIIQQKLRPNMQLVEDVLAESFGVSRTPVRNVLRQLAYEKLVVIIPRKGTFVSCPTVEEAKEVFEMRRILEPTSIQKVCNHLSEEQISQLKSMIDEESAAHSKGDFLEAIKIAGNFHLEIARYTENSYYYRYLEELISLTYVILAYYGRSHLEHCNSNEHLDILNALQMRDGNVAKEIMLNHLTNMELSLDFNESTSDLKSLADIFKNT